MPFYFCKEDINENGFLNCSGIGSFTFNRTNLRFMSTFTLGYVHDVPGRKGQSSYGNEGDSTPHMSIGHCKAI